MSRSIILDPRSESATNAPLEIFREAGRGPGVYINAGGEAYPDPPVEKNPSQGREGERYGTRPRIGNRQIPLKLVVVEGDAPAATNLITNPSIETATTGYAAVLSGVLSQTSAHSAYGESSLQIDTPATALAGARSEIVDVAASSTVQGLAWFKAPFGQTINLELREYSAASALLGTTTVAVTATGNWQQVQASRTFGGTGVKAALAVTQAAAVVQTIYADAFALAVGTAPLAAFISGDLPGCTWSGTAHASTSVRPAPGGTRMDAIMRDLESKLEKLREAGGTYSRQFTIGRGIFDVQTIAGGAGELNGRAYAQGVHTTDVTFEALPYMRGTPVVGSSHAETVSPVLTWEEDAPAGSTWALGELEFLEASGVPRFGLVAGVEVADYVSGAANIEPYLQAEALTPLGGGAIATQTGANGGGSNNVVETTLAASWGGVLSTTKVSGSADLAHVGTYVVWARVWAPTGNTGIPSLRLMWAQGDLIAEAPAGDPQVVPTKGVGYLVRLGIIRPTKVRTGAQRWRGRIIGKSTVTGDKIRIDDIRFVPAGEAYIEASAPYVLKAPDSYSARDGFDQSSGSLNGKTSPLGGVWATSGAASDFQVSGAGSLTLATQQATRLAALPVSMTDAAVSIDFKYSAVPTGGILQSRVERNGYALAINQTPTGTSLLLGSNKSLSVQVQKDVYYTIVLVIVGDFAYGFFGPTGALQLLLAASGASGTGNPTIADGNPSGGTITRTYDNFAAWVPSANAVIQPSKKAYWRYDGFERDDLTGSGRSPITPDGDLLYVPPKRTEGRKLRAVAFATRGDLDQLPDTDPGDDLTGKLTMTPRYPTVRG